MFILKKIENKKIKNLIENSFFKYSYSTFDFVETCFFPEKTCIFMLQSKTITMVKNNSYLLFDLTLLLDHSKTTAYHSQKLAYWKNVMLNHALRKINVRRKKKTLGKVKGSTRTHDPRASIYREWYLTHHAILKPNKAVKLFFEFYEASTLLVITLSKSFLADPDLLHNIVLECSVSNNTSKSYPQKWRFLGD